MAEIARAMAAAKSTSNSWSRYRPRTIITIIARKAMPAHDEGQAVELLLEGGISERVLIAFLLSRSRV